MPKKAANTTMMRSGARELIAPMLRAMIMISVTLTMY